MSLSRLQRPPLALVEPPVPAWQQPAPERILPFADSPRANRAVILALAIAVVTVVLVLVRS